MSLRKEILQYQKPDKDGNFWIIHVGSSGGTYSLPCFVEYEYDYIVDLLTTKRRCRIKYWNPDLEEEVSKIVPKSDLRSPYEYTAEMMQVALDNVGDWL
jgi:hypothetical protein